MKIESSSEMGRLIMAYNGTIEHFAGDGIMIVFADADPIFSFSFSFHTLLCQPLPIDHQ